MNRIIKITENCIRSYRSIILVFGIFLICFTSVKAQDFLLLDNVFPTSYKFTAGLLKNGHFFINTKYAADTTNQLIYREDNTGLKPINYTSFVHFKIDNYIFQLPFENNPATQFPPPENQIIVTGLFRDTIQKVPRINASMLAIMPDRKDSVWVTFTMHPFKRANGGFIRFISRIDSSRFAHNIGVLLLVDTKVATNDRAPIITSYGYYKNERQFEKTVAPGIPEFWLAIEGSPVKPGLTARGNIKASGLITPDLFMFGNWSDYTANGFIKGLSSFLWKDRKADDTLAYFDSAVLLVWDEKAIAASRQRIELSSTEIGIVDSLEVVDAGASYGGGGGGGGMGDGLFYARVSGCIQLDTVRQLDCNDKNYYPYNPDTMQVIFIITNTKNKTFQNLNIKLGTLQPGVETVGASNTFIPNSLKLDETGIGVISLKTRPRLKPYNYYVPFAIMGNANDTLGIDSLCVIVPGIQARDSIVDLSFKVTCPSTSDTASTQAFLLGLRCRQVDSVYIIGNPPGVNCFKVVSPKPNIISPNAPENIALEFKPSGLGVFNASVVYRIKDWDDFPGGDTVIVADTANLTGIGKDEEFMLAGKDTLNFGRICVGDTSLFEWPILNLGGCEVLIQNAGLINNKLFQFSLSNSAKFPMRIPREDIGSIGKCELTFHPVVGGWDTSKLVISSVSFPYSDTLVIIGYGDIPTYSIKNSITKADTICQGERANYSFTLDNATACAVQIDSVWIETVNATSLISPDRFTITKVGNVDLNIVLNSSAVGTITSRVFIKSYGKIDSSVIFTVPVASRTADLGALVAFGDVRLKTAKRTTKTISSTGTAGVEISNIRVQGVHQQDFKIILPNGVTLPYYLAPGRQFTYDVEFTPTDIETRQAEVIVDFTRDKICTQPPPVSVNGRGIRPLLTILQDKIDFERVCVGEKLDTFFIVKNSGNGPLNINRLKTSGSNDFIIEKNLPLFLDTNVSAKIKISFAPSLIGKLTSGFTYETDADWLFPQDTIFDLSGAGIICGEISIDTISALVGSKINIPVRIKSSTSVPSSDFAQIMNNSGLNDVSFSIANNSKLFRFDGNSNGSGMVGNSPVYNYYPDSIKISKNPADNLMSNNLLSLPSGEVLLGDDYIMPLNLTLNNFAGGYNNLIIKNGLLNLEYCALDKRMIIFDSTKTLLAYISKENGGFRLNVYSPNSIQAGIKNHNILGQEISIIYEGLLNKGWNKFDISNNLPNGLNIFIINSSDQAKSILLLK